MKDKSSEDQKQRFGSITAEDVARLDAAAAELGVDTDRLMEHAGWQVARCAALLETAPSRVAVIAGSGNNGGDGVVAARLLATWGFAVRVLVMTDEAKLGSAARARIETSRRCGVAIEITQDVAKVEQVLAETDLAIDGLLGSGLKGAPRPEVRSVIEALSRVKTLAIDLPSGMNATTGDAKACVTPYATCTLAAVKRGLWTASGRQHTGRLFVADIGIPAVAWSKCNLSAPTFVKNGELSEV